jgi:hypothetical protein
MGGRFTAAVCTLVLTGVLAPQTGEAKPVFSATGTTAMAEYREGAMQEAQIFYAPDYNWSVGLSHMTLDSHGGQHEFDANYARFNLLLKRWNFENAQANIIGWGGLGTAHLKVPDNPVPGDDHSHGGPPPTAWREYTINATNWGGQVDFETLRYYASFRTDLQDTPKYWHRVDTVEFGFAPYKHKVDSLATWILVSASNYAGNLHEGTETALLLRFFKKRVWVEAGATTRGELRASAMFSF